MTMSVKLLSAWKQVLENCKVKAGENLVFLLADHSNHTGFTVSTSSRTLESTRIWLTRHRRE